MTIRTILSGALIGALFLSSTVRVGADAPSMRGYTSAQASIEFANERAVDAAPTAAQAMRDEMGLASYVHRMGQPGDLRSALYVRDQLARAGWDAKLVTYVVPIAYPTLQAITLLGAHPRSLELHEPGVAGDPYSQNHAAIGIPYSGYSNDGDVTGPVIYVNHARPDDFAKLAVMHVDVRGAILVARGGGGGSLTGKAFEGAKHGARAVLVFQDPMSGGYWSGDPYPKGPYRPTGGAVRNTMLFTNDPGDPTAIGIPVPGAKHKPFSSIVLPSIPEMPITSDVAHELLAAIAGPSAPTEWHPGFGMPVHLGDATTRAHFVLKSKRFLGPIWDVIATLKGKSSQLVMAGGHRDAWTYGAVDPISGTVDLIQLGRALGTLHARGWIPERTIQLGSWDGEELNLFGSATWVEQHAADLRKNLVAYVNTDEVAFGPTFGAYATPDLAAVIRDVSSVAHAPDGRTIAAYWGAQDPKLAVDPVGGGSDHEAFVYHEGLPAAGGGFGGPFGSYHTAYDSVASLRIFDPGMHRSVAATHFTSLLVMRLADATYPDLRLNDVATALRDRIAAFAVETGNADRRGTVVAKLRLDADGYVVAASALDTAADAAVASGGDTGVLAGRLRLSEAAFFNPNAPTWQRSLLYDLNGYTSSVLPTLPATLDPKSGDAALTQLDAAFVAATAAATGAAPASP
ncbi:MAG: M28 family peptidase [Candidatus Eremiobacteraeota bacterium]|nr:M28 family peptidase [Candidatus Eremiobacteraeota bacterium]